MDDVLKATEPVVGEETADTLSETTQPIIGELENTAGNVLPVDLLGK